MKVAANFQGQFSAGFQNNRHSGLEMDDLSGLMGKIACRISRTSSGRLASDKFCPTFSFCCPRPAMQVPAGLLHLVFGDDQASVVSHPFPDVIFHPGIEILFSAQEDLFTPCLIFEAKLVVVV